MKTDNRNLFEYSVKSFVNYGYKINDISLDLHQANYPDNIMTEYEEKFVSKGSPIYMIDVSKQTLYLHEKKKNYSQVYKI